MEKRTKLPSKLYKRNFLIKLPRVEEMEEEEGLVNPEKDDNKVIVAMASDTCSIEEGDDLILNERAFPSTVLTIGEDRYAINK